MADDSATVAVVLAAGEGRRLRPLTDERPKVLCPVANRPLLDLAIERARTVVDPGGAVAVNAHHHAAAVAEHLAATDPGVHLSVEGPEALGTAGAVGLLRPWIAGRDVLVVNGDAWFPGSLAPLADGWDRQRVRLLVAHDPDAGDFGPWRYIGAALMPWQEVAPLEPEPTGLYEVSWRRLLAADAVELVPTEVPFVDCGTPADYLAANLLASGGESVVGPDAVVDGTIERCVLWAGARVAADEHLVECVRTASGLTVDCRPAATG